MTYMTKFIKSLTQKVINSTWTDWYIMVSTLFTTDCYKFLMKLLYETQWMQWHQLRASLTSSKCRICWKQTAIAVDKQKNIIKSKILVYFQKCGNVDHSDDAWCHDGLTGCHYLHSMNKDLINNISLQKTAKILQIKFHYDKLKPTLLLGC